MKLNFHRMSLKKTSKKIPLHPEKPSKTIEKPWFFKVFAHFNFIHFCLSWTLSLTPFCLKTWSVGQFWRSRVTQCMPSWLPGCVLGGHRGGQGAPFHSLVRTLAPLDAPLWQFGRLWEAFSFNFRVLGPHFHTFSVFLHVQEGENDNINTATWRNATQ